MIGLLWTIAVYGLILFLIEKFIPMVEPFRLIFRFIVVIWVISILLGYGPLLPLPPIVRSR